MKVFKTIAEATINRWLAENPAIRILDFRIAVGIGLTAVGSNTRSETHGVCVFLYEPASSKKEGTARPLASRSYTSI